MIDRTGVLYLLAHLIITLVLAGGYLYTVVNGHPDTTLQNVLLAIVGYWFGAMGADKFKQQLEKKDGEPK